MVVGDHSVTGEREWCQDLGQCEQLCYLEQEAELCDCYPGYTLSPDSTSCQDIDECETNNGGCDQICHNRPGTFMCEVSSLWNINPTTSINRQKRLPTFGIWLIELLKNFNR